MPTIIYMSVEKLAFAVEEESHEAKISFGRGLWLVCHSSLFSTELAGGHLVGDPRQQLMLKQGRPRTAWSYIGHVLAEPGNSWGKCLYFQLNAYSRPKSDILF